MIGNKNYNGSLLPLRNPANDALRIAALLKRLGFRVECLLDLTQREMDTAVRDFTNDCRLAGTAVLFYAGHGLQVGDLNMLMPIDFKLHPHEVLREQIIKSALSLREFVDATAECGRTLAFIDACREKAGRSGAVDPAVAAWRGALKKGFAAIDPEQQRRNLMLSFSADFNEFAQDGEKSNSPYTAALAEFACQPISIAQLLEKVRDRVQEATEKVQFPTQIDRLPSYYLHDGSEPLQLPDRPTDPDDRLFADIAFIDTIATYEFYLNEFLPGEGRHAEAAKASLVRLRTGPDGDDRHERFRDHALAPEMVVVPGLSGSNARPFAVARYPTTFDDWEAAVAAKGMLYTPGDAGWGTGRRPVVHVHYADVQDYLGWLKHLTGKAYRLLTAAEWQHCCLAGGNAEFATGNTITPLQACFSDDRVKQPSTIEVGQFKPNAFGLHDMHGNVWEWCSDLVHVAGERHPHRVAKGGCWESWSADVAATVSATYPETSREPYIGFRVARDIL